MEGIYIMDYNNSPNLLLESLAYFGRKASNNTWKVTEQKIKKRKIENYEINKIPRVYKRKCKIIYLV